MIPCISVENMRESDSYTISTLTPGTELMYRAAYGVFLSSRWDGAVAILAGSGNNGGDGYALACILHKNNIPSTVFTVGHKVTPDSAYYLLKAKEYGIPIEPFSSNKLNGYDIIVDCLLGTGFHGTVRQDYHDAIEAINSSNAYVISVDINSGMNGNTGEAEIAVISNLTVTVGYVKKGLVSEPSGKYIKHLVCADIGIALVRDEWFICSADEMPDTDCGILCPPWLDMTVIRTY